MRSSETKGAMAALNGDVQEKQRFNALFGERGQPSTETWVRSVEAIRFSSYAHTPNIQP